MLRFVIWFQLVDNYNKKCIGGFMKGKPDSMVALVFLFCIGLAATGFASILSDDDARIGQVSTVQQAPAKL